MKTPLQVMTLSVVACAAAHSQSQAGPRPEFEVASIRSTAPQTGHFRAPASTRGGPGTAEPTLFRCTNCNLAYLLSTAFGLQRYQLPGQTALPETAFDVSARIPQGTTQEQFALMLQNLLKDRFGLAYHFETKQVQGYELVVAKGGPRLKESGEAKPAPEAGHGDARPNDPGAAWHDAGNQGSHGMTRPGLMFFNGQANYRGERQSTAELAQMIATQLAKPVDDATGLHSRYDISLSWSDDGSHAASHPAGGADFGGHGDHGGAQGSLGVQADGASGPGLLAALQTQLGLRLEAKKATAKVFIVDHVEKSPTDN